MTRRLYLYLFALVLTSSLAVFGQNCSSTSCVTLSGVSPATGSTVSSPVTFKATATSSASKPITAWAIYDNTATPVFQNSGGTTLSASVALSTGSHTITVRAWDSTGADGDAVLKLTVGTTSTVTVSVSTPQSGATLTSPVNFQATGVCPNYCGGWKIYLDNVETWSIAGPTSSINADVALPTGTHSVVVQTFDHITGVSGNQKLSLNITGTVTGTGSIQGTVTDASTGLPINGATVAWSGGSTTTASGSSVPTGHIFFVAEENNKASNVLTAANMPYLVNTLLPKAVSFTNYYANMRGSLSDYLWVAAGSGFTSQCNGDHCSTSSPGSNPAQNFVVTSDNIVRAMNNAGVTWKGYFESMPSVGYLGTQSGNYVERHNPFPWFSDLNNTTQQQKMVPFTQFATDLANNTFAQFNWITPNLQDDAHDGTLQQADTWLQNNIGPLLNSSYFQPGGDGILVIWWDETDYNSPEDNSCSSTVSTGCGGKVSLLIIGPKVKAGTTDATYGQHQMLLRMMLKYLGLTDFMNGAAQTTTDFSEAYNSTASGTYTLTKVATGTQAISYSDTGYTAVNQNVTVSSGVTTTNNVALAPTATGGGGSGGGQSSGSTTTLAAETNGNTSAADNWPTSSNGDLTGNANISHVSVKNLMYSGSNSNMLMNFLLWWCTGTPGNVSTTTYACGHPQIGYNSNDANQVHAQLNDLASRGFDGVVIDWYGRGAHKADAATMDQVAQKTVADITNYASTRPFKFMLMEDHEVDFVCGGSTWSSNGYSSQTACVYGEIDADMDYANTHYFGSPYMLKSNGHPIVLFFITEGSSNLTSTNWSTVWSTVASHTSTESNGSPVFIFQGKGGFTHASSSGAYSWVNNFNQLAGAYSSNEGIDYLNDFYNSYNSNYSKIGIGSMWKGFNDGLASWGSGRIMDQKCGHTWIDTLAEAGTHYNTSHQIPYMQATTWNDYEEGTELETGIDSCNSVSATLSGTVLSWVKGGSGFADTIDHYTVYSSQDRVNLTVVQDNIAPTSTNLDLSNYALPSGTNYLYVKLVSKNSISNAISGAATLTVTNSPPVAGLSLNPTTGVAPLTITADTSNSTDDTGIVTRTISWGDGSPVQTLTDTSALHTYSRAGTYTVTLTVTDGSGASGTTSQPLKVTSVTSSNTAVFTLLTNGSYVYSPVRVLGQLTTANPPITHARIIVDGTVAFDYASTSLSSIYNFDKYVFMSGGAWHTVKLEGVDSNGTVWDSQVLTLYDVGHTY